MNLVLVQAWVSALLAGVLSFASPKESSQRKGDPEGGAPSGFLALLGTPGGWRNSPAAQTTPADCPRHSCVAQRLPRGPERRPGSTVLPKKADSYGQPGKPAKIVICQLLTLAPTPSLPRPRHTRASASRRAKRESRMLDSRLRGNDVTQVSLRVVSPGPLRGAEQRRGWWIKGEDCLRAKPEFRSPARTE